MESLTVKLLHRRGSVINVTGIVFQMALILGFNSEAATAAPSGKASNQVDVESILDRLERKLIDNESGGLTFDESRKSKHPGRKIESPSTFYKYKGDAGHISESDAVDGNIKQISEMIAGLDAQVERLEADIQKARLKVAEDARVDNFIDVEAIFDAPENVSLKSLRVEIDGVTVYSAKDAGGLWLKSGKIPLYSGPLPPGSHKLSINAGVGTRETSTVPVSGDSARKLSRDFVIRIPDGKEKRKVALFIHGPKASGVDGSISISGAGEEKP